MDMSLILMISLQRSFETKCASNHDYLKLHLVGVEMCPFHQHHSVRSFQVSQSTLFIMYKKIIFNVLLISIYSQVKCSDETSTCKEIESKSAPLRLKRHLLCDYDTTIRPVIGTHSSLEVHVMFIPKFVEMNERSDTLNFHTWLVMSWKDAHLHWEPSEFEALNWTYVKSNEIWTPDFSIFNSGDLGVDQSNLPLSNCFLAANGEVQCVTARMFTAHCPADYSNWPYDKHNCTLHFGSWMHFSDELSFKYAGIFHHEFVENQLWDVEIDNLTSASSLYHSAADVMIFLRVGLERHGNRGAFVFITPAVALATLTLIVLWLDSRSIERIAVASVNFISHILFILDIHWYLPSSGATNVPKILAFYEISLIISACTLIFTSFVRKIYSMTAPAPRGVLVFTTGVINSPIGRFLKIDNVNGMSETILEDSENNHSGGKKASTWQDCAVILEWLALIIVTLTYIILLCVILPAPPKKPIEDYVY